MFAAAVCRVLSVCNINIAIYRLCEEEGEEGFGLSDVRLLIALTLHISCSSTTYTPISVVVAYAYLMHAFLLFTLIVLHFNGLSGCC